MQQQLRSSIIAALGLAACATTTPPAERPPAPAKAASPVTAFTAPARVVQGPGQVVTPAGARLQVPAGLAAHQQGRVIELRDAERSVKVYLVEVEGQQSGAAAVKAAWAAVDPGFARKTEQALSPPPREGFDEVYVETYVTRPDGEVAQAVARRKGPRSWVALVRGMPGHLDRRDAQIRTFLASIKAPGIEEIDLQGKAPRTFAAIEAELVAFIEGAVQATNAPGLQIAVVQDGKVALARGFGVREVGKPRPVTPDTLMMIGSVSKSLSTLLMATLVDEGKLSWTSPVREVDARFRLADEQLTAALTVEQLVCACAGVPRKDLPLILEFENKQPDDVYRELAAMKPSTGLRETFQYQNHMVAAGGYLAAHVCDPWAPRGPAFDRAMRQRIFAPLGMRDTTLDHSAAMRSRRRATPHSLNLEGKHLPVSLEHERFATYVRPSGGIWSTANDMARYLLTELGRGVTPGGKRVASEASLTHRWAPQVKISADVSYGLGWITAKRKGLRQIQHGGGTMGFATLMVFLPEKGLGAVMISNGTGGHLAESAIWSRLLELWFGVDEQAAAGLKHKVNELHGELRKLRARLSTPSAEWMQPHVGTHTNPELGKLVIAAAKDGYVLDAGEYRTRLMRHDRLDGKQVLMFVDPPLMGLELEPLAKQSEGTFELKRAQERYVFQRAR